MKRIRNEEDDKEVISKVITVAGDFVHDGRDMNSKFEQLRDVRRDDEGRGADEDAGKEGLRMILHGGIYPLSSKEGRKGRKQSAIVDFVCDTSRTGLEGLGSDEGDVEMQRLIRRAQTNGDVGITAEKNPSLQLISYGIDPADDERDLLRLRWLTKYACDKMASDPDGDTDPVAPSPDLPGSDASSGHGFFFWVFLV